MSEGVLIAIIGGVISLLVAIVPKIIDAKTGMKKRCQSSLLTLRRSRPCKRNKAT